MKIYSEIKEIVDNVYNSKYTLVDYCSSVKMKIREDLIAYGINENELYDVVRDHLAFTNKEINY